MHSPETKGRGPIATVDPVQFRKVNVTGTLVMMQAFLDQLTPAEGAAVSLTKLCAVELAGHGIRFNAVGPGGVVTEGTAGVSADPEREARFNAVVPLGRRAQPADIADVVPFLLSDDARYITGQVLYVDGGLTEATIDFLRAVQSGG